MYLFIFTKEMTNFNYFNYIYIKSINYYKLDHWIIVELYFNQEDGEF